MHDGGFVIGPNENGLSIIIDNTGIYFMKDDAIALLKIVGCPKENELLRLH